jgi:hypothetical protein
MGRTLDNWIFEPNSPTFLKSLKKKEFEERSRTVFKQFYFLFPKSINKQNNCGKLGQNLSTFSKINDHFHGENKSTAGYHRLSYELRR